MKLTDLEAAFVDYSERTESDPAIDGGRPRLARIVTPKPSMLAARGVWFLCPACFQKNGGAVGTHLVEATFRGRNVPDHMGSQSKNGGPSRWDVSGTGLDDLTLQPSIDCGCWHGYVTNGEVTFV